MSVLLEPREVLSYLNELGYTHITAQQLKDFMKDLKKLIKYDVRQQNKKIKTPLTENLSELSKFAQFDTFLYTTPSAPTPKTKKRREQNKLAQVDSYLHSTTSALSSKPKTKENVITVEVKRPRQNKSVTTDAPPTSRGEVNEKNEEEAVVRSKIGKSKSTGKILGKSQATLKHGASFIRPKELQLKTSKSDPVALYHKYQAEWKKVRFPGEDMRTNLRWAVREKMMGGDTGQQRAISAAASMDVLARKKQDSRNV